MLKLSENDIAEFQRLYKEETGQDINREEAAVYAERVIRVVAFARGIKFLPPL